MTERPDLSKVQPEVIDYIAFLEAEIKRLQLKGPSQKPVEADLPALPSEPPTTINLLTLTARGILKRTPRHLYQRQRRGGMGIFDLDTSESDPPAVLASADEAQSILLFTDQARAFRLPVAQLEPEPVRAKGQSLSLRLGLLPEERLVAALADVAKGAVAMVSERGMVRYLRHHIFGEYMKPGTAMFNLRQFGKLTAVCRTPGDADLFIATRGGKAIRFSEKLIPTTGGLGIRLEEGDAAIGIASVNDESGVFLIDEEGDGTIRLMSAFNANKSAGGGGKIAMNTDRLVAAVTVAEGEEIFIISRLSKIIRILPEEIPAKEGVVQGVHCMMLRSDQVVSAITA